MVRETENIYGHLKRVNWICSRLKPGAKVLEVGCGTGFMVTRILLERNFDATGIDLDAKSIAFGQQILAQMGFEPGRICVADLHELNQLYDAIILSEVVEHVSTAASDDFIQAVYKRLSQNGQLFVTVPNGYGWFELESFLWFKAQLGLVLRMCRIEFLILRTKYHLLGSNFDFIHPSSLANSPHLQFFTRKSARSLLERNGFNIIATSGSVLFCGPFSNLFFTGLRPIMALNCYLGNLFPSVAAGFYFCCRKKS